MHTLCMVGMSRTIRQITESKTMSVQEPGVEVPRVHEPAVENLTEEPDLEESKGAPGFEVESSEDAPSPMRDDETKPIQVRLHAVQPGIEKSKNDTAAATRRNDKQAVERLRCDHMSIAVDAFVPARWSLLIPLTGW